MYPHFPASIARLTRLSWFRFHSLSNATRQIVAPSTTLIISQVAEELQIVAYSNLVWCTITSISNIVSSKPRETGGFDFTAVQRRLLPTLLLRFPKPLPRIESVPISSEKAPSTTLSISQVAEELQIVAYSDLVWCTITSISNIVSSKPPEPGLSRVLYSQLLS
jgi:hypothetical protein